VAGDPLDLRLEAAAGRRSAGGALTVVVSAGCVTTCVVVSGGGVTTCVTVAVLVSPHPINRPRRKHRNGRGSACPHVLPPHCCLPGDHIGGRDRSQHPRSAPECRQPPDSADPDPPLSAVTRRAIATGWRTSLYRLVQAQVFFAVGVLCVDVNLDGTRRLGAAHDRAIAGGLRTSSRRTAGPPHRSTRSHAQRDPARSGSLSSTSAPARNSPQETAHSLRHRHVRIWSAIRERRTT